MEDETIKDDPQEPETPKPSVWTKKNAFILSSMAYANFTLGTCYSLPAPFFPAEAEKKGASPTVYGFVFGVFQLVNLVMSPTWGKMMPHLVPRFVMVAGIFVAGGSSVLFGILDEAPSGVPFISLAFAVRIVESVGVTAYITTCYGMLPVFFPNNVGTVISTMETLFGFGMIAGPTVGGALYQVGGYKLPFIVMGSMLMAGSVATIFSFKSRDENVHQKTGSMWAMVASPGMVVDMLLFCLGFICIGFNDATLEPHLRQFNLKPAILGLVFIIVGGIYALSSPVFGFMTDKGVDPHIIAVVGCALTFVSFLIIGPVPFLPFKPSLPVIIVALALQGIGIGAKGICAFMHAMKDVLSRGFPDNVATYALFTGTMSAMSAVGAFAGPSLGGFLLEHVGYAYGSLVIASLEVLLVSVTGNGNRQFQSMLVIIGFRLGTWCKGASSGSTLPSTIPRDHEEIQSESDETTPLLSSNNP